MKEKSVIAQVVSRSRDTNVPILLNFQNGSLDAVNKENTKFSKVKYGDSKGVVVAAGDQIYHGESDAPNDKLTDTYICVRNKETHKVRIIPIDEVTLKNHVFAKLAGKKTLPTLSEDYSRQKLMKEFGGRKAARFMANQERLKMDIDTVRDELDNTVKETTLTDDVGDAVETEKHYDQIRPPLNQEAEAVADVYDIKDVVSMELLDRLNEEAKTVHSTPAEHIPITSEALLSIVREIQKLNATPESLLRLKLIIYMDCLKNLIVSRARKMAGVELSQITEKVENDVRKRFTDPNLKQFTKTPLYTEKALCHYIVLALLLGENYETNLNTLSQELNMPRQKVLQYAQIVKAKRKGQSDTLKLCLPGSVPSLPMKFQRRSKN